MTVLKLNGVDDQLLVQEAPEALLISIMQAEDPMSVICVTDQDGDAFYFERSLYCWHQAQKTQKSQRPKDDVFRPISMLDRK